MGEDIDALKDVGYPLHQRLLDGDLTATAEIAESFMRPLYAKLYRRYPKLDDPHLIETAVEDALLNYFGRPQQYDPGRLNLFSYLRMSAEGDLRNLLSKHRKDRERHVALETVELNDTSSEQSVEVPDDFDLEAEVASRDLAIYSRISELLPNLLDQEIALLIIEGERATDVYAQVLGIAHLPPGEKADEVKRHKDRIKKRLKRNFPWEVLK